MLNIDIGGAKHIRVMNGLWKIMDINKKADYVYDINSGKKIKLKDNLVDNIYTSMTLEHIKPSLQLFFLSELKRILKPNGLIRIIVPDGLIAINWYLNEPKKLRQKGNPSKPDFYPDTKMGRLLAWFFTEDRKNSSGHKMSFDMETLNWLLNKVGFKNIKRLKYNECSPIFKGKDYERYMEYSIYVELNK